MDIYSKQLKNGEFTKVEGDGFVPEPVQLNTSKPEPLQNEMKDSRSTKEKLQLLNGRGIDPSFPVFVREIKQNDPHRFTIEWSDGIISEYRLSDLQRMCSCARCRDEKTGRVLIDPSSISDDLQAVRIVSVGRYALKIFFSKGCSKGIYSFKLLRAKTDLFRN